MIKFFILKHNTNLCYDTVSVERFSNSCLLRQCKTYIGQLQGNLSTGAHPKWVGFARLQAPPIEIEKNNNNLVDAMTW